MQKRLHRVKKPCFDPFSSQQVAFRVDSKSNQAIIDCYLST